MTSLIAQIKSHCTLQGSQGVKTLALTKVCIDHMEGDSGDWSPLAMLIGRSQPAQSRIIKKIVEKILQGYSIVKDEKQDSGLRISKIADMNQGFDEGGKTTLATLVSDKATLQGAAVKDAFLPKVDKPDFDISVAVEKSVKAMEKDGVSLEDYIAALLAYQAGLVVEPDF
jgi:hypothetical protein